MGSNSSKKLAAKCSFLSKDEQLIISNSFKVVSRNSERIKEEELTKLWSTQLEPRLLTYINNYLFATHAGCRQQTVELEKFAEFFVFCTRGTVEEKLKVLMVSLGRPEDSTDGIELGLIKEYVESVVASYVKIQKQSGTVQLKSWFNRGCFASVQNVQRLVDGLTYQLSSCEENPNSSEIVTFRTIEVWLQSSTLLGQILQCVFMHLYNISHKEKAVITDKGDTCGSSGDQISESNSHSLPVAADGRSLVPFCRGLDLIPSYPSLLDLSHLIFINAHLPQQFQLEWRFLFSSQIHGESFATLIGRIVNQGPTVLILEDGNGHLFGGFAPASWDLCSTFYGDDSSFLFSLIPCMRVYPSTGYNQHFQYLNIHQQTLPNGLAMGGQHEYHGLFLDCDYGKGHSSPSCTTYAPYRQLSQSNTFMYRHLEVWAVGMAPPTAQERGERSNVVIGMSGLSVLDGNADAKALLEMAGKSMHSETVGKIDIHNC